MNTPTVHVAFTADRGYQPHAAALLDSLLTVHAGESLALHLLQGPDHADADSANLERWLGQRGQRLLRLRVTEAMLNGFHTKYFHRSIWYRVLLPDLMPEATRVLYLDADTLVTSPLQALWNLDLGQALFAAVINPLYPFMPNWPVEKLGLPSERRYPNSGVLLMDLARMRAEGFVDGVRRYAADHIRAGCAEQDALAAVYHERCHFLHPRWNAQTPLFDLPVARLPWGPDEVEAARRNPAIVHFTGPAKPSHYLCRHPFRDAYLRHRAATPWPLARAEGRTLLNFLLRRLPLVWEVRYARVRDALLRRLGFNAPVTQ